jgi:hypothetical protein
MSTSQIKEQANPLLNQAEDRRWPPAARQSS